MSIYSRVFNKVRQEGFIKLLQGGVTYLYDLYYDYKFGLDTYSWVSKNKLEVEDSINEHAVKYQATRALSLIRLFKKLKIDLATALPSPTGTLFPTCLDCSDLLPKNI